MRLIRYSFAAILALAVGVTVPAFAQHDHDGDRHERDKDKGRGHSDARDNGRGHGDARDRHDDHGWREARDHDDHGWHGEREHEDRRRHEGWERQEAREREHERHEREEAWEHERHEAYEHHYRRIDDDDWHRHFGHEHRFVIVRPVIVAGHARFRYGGYWFVISRPLPPGWRYSDQVYVDHDDDGYFMCSPRHPGVHIAIDIM